MPLLTPSERKFASALSRLTYCNHFLPERIELEKEALGEDFVVTEPVWSLRRANEQFRPNIVRLRDKSVALTLRAREQLARSPGQASREELALYRDLVLYLLYAEHWPHFQGLIDQADESLKSGRRKSVHAPKVHFYDRYRKSFDELLRMPKVEIPDLPDPLMLFAALFQIRRAFHYVFNNIVGASLPAARLRAAVWQSIFTHDMQRYQRGMYERMADMTTLVTGPSGTGKELVARAIALARYIPFDEKSRAFVADYSRLFYPLNLSALAPTLIESELFGHRRGAFTGALQDRVGWLQTCPALGTVFLDEIGDLDPQIQVKLLRVLQSRMFQRLGDTKDLRFEGKIIAATNRNLPEQMRDGRFREDFYYRLCSDIIVTPSLREQLLDGQPDALRQMILFIAQRIAGPVEAESLASEVECWIEKNLRDDYTWPGNFRELEQCVKNILIRREYHPPTPSTQTPAEQLAQQLENGELTADELLRRYCQLVYRQTRSYEETARRLKLDRRTVKAKLT